MGAPEVQFLRHLVTPFGVSPDLKKIEAMLKMPMPSTKGDLRSLLGSVSYLRKKLPGLSTSIKDLHALLCKDVRFEFTDHHAAITKKVLQQLVSSMRFWRFRIMTPPSTALESSSWGPMHRKKVLVRR